MSEQGRRAVAKHGKRAAKFALVGVLNTLVDILVYAGLLLVSFHPLVANFVAFLVANIQSYFINARFTFATNGKAASVSVFGYAKYALTHSFSLAASTIVIAVLASRIGAIPAKLVAVLLTFGVNYVASSALVFRGSTTSTKRPEQTK